MNDKTCREPASDEPASDEPASNTAASELTSEELMTLHQNGHPGAFDEILQRHKGMVEGIVVNLLSRWAPRLRMHVADLTQEVFLYIHTHRGRFIRGTRFNAWLAKIARRAVLKLIEYETAQKRDYRRTSYTDNRAPWIICPRTASTRVLDLKNNLEHLPETHRTVLQMSYREGYTNAEIARKLGTSRATIEWWRREGLALMQATVEAGDPSIA